MKFRNPPFQESDRAAQIPSPDDVNLAKFRKAAGDNFLGLGINPCSRYCNKNPKAAINLGKKVNLGIGRALNPTPLRSYHPTQGFFLCSSSSSDHHDGASSSKLKKKKNKGGPGRRRVDEIQHPEPTNPPQELVQRVGPDVRPVFLYRKQLAEWDTQEHQNRLFVNDRKKLMDFMTEEERVAVEDPEKPGIDVDGIDSLGREYDLHTNRWESLDKVVVKREWYKIIAANEAKKGDWVHLWAFRRGAKICLFVDFRNQP